MLGMLRDNIIIVVVVNVVVIIIQLINSLMFLSSTKGKGNTNLLRIYKISDIGAVSSSGVFVLAEMEKGEFCS